MDNQELIRKLREKIQQSIEAQAERLAEDARRLPRAFGSPTIDNDPTPDADRLIKQALGEE